MRPEDMKAAIDQAVAKYGDGFEIFVHGPGHDGAFRSGFGVEVNWYMAEITQTDGNKILALCVHGLPITYPEKEGLQKFPIETGVFPLRSKRIEGDV